MKYYLLLLIIILQSCITPTPQYVSKNPVNDNPAMFSINGATLKNKKSVIGISTQIISTGIGSYLGYRFFPVAIGAKDNKMNQSAIGGAVLGAVVGFGVNNSFNYLAGERKVFGVGQHNYSLWKKKFDPGNRFISVNNDYSALEFVERSYEERFPIDNLKDAVYFNTAFPNSAYKQIKFDKAVEVADRFDLPHLSRTYQNVNQEKLYTKHLLSSITFNDYKQSAEMFPANKSRAEVYLAKTAKSFNEIKEFLDLYPESSHKKSLIEKVFSNESVFNSFTRNELKRLPGLLKLKDNSYDDQISSRVISLASSLNEAFEDYELYINKRPVIELQAASLVTDSRTFDAYKSRMPKSKHIHKLTDGVYDQEEGYVITSDWDDKTNKPGDYKRVVFKSKSEVYVGTYFNGKKSGYGILDANLQNKGYEVHYEGNFWDGKLRGHGKLTDNTADCKITYDGEFKDNFFEGNGTANGKLGDCYSWFGNDYASYTGGWKQGKFHGRGKYTQGELWYEGGFENGAMNGNGLLRLPNGVRIEGNWKNHQPNGEMHLFKYTLLGIVRNDQRIVAYSMKDLAIGESALLDKWNNRWASGSSDSDRETERREEEEEKAGERKRADNERDEKYVRKCIQDLDKSLRKATFKEEGLFNDCPCVYYEDPDFLGYKLELRANDKNEWYFKNRALLNFQGWQGPFVSKGDALRDVCERWNGVSKSK